jgi:hypothetical protein
MMRTFVFLFCLNINTEFLIAQDFGVEYLLLRPEKTEFNQTSSHADVISFLERMESLSKNVKVISMGGSLENRNIPLAILANPMVSTPEEVLKSGKAVIYIQGNIHAGEVEGKESIMMLMREILLGEKKYLLDNLIILLAPIYNTDANEKLAKGLRPSQEDSPPETGQRESSQGYDLNRDGIKMDAIETRALFQKVIMPWDPQIFVDLHTTNGTWHAYPLTWAPSYHSIGEKSVFDYSYSKMLPQITDSVFKKHNLRFGKYGDYSLDEGWPPRNFYSYSYMPRYLVNQFGFRNRMAILSEAFAHNRFYERINSTLVFITEILEYANSHHREIIEINKKADEACVKNAISNAGKVKKGVKFRMTVLDTINNFLTYDYFPVLKSDGTYSYKRMGKIVTYDKVQYHAAFEPVIESTVPRGYILPAHFEKVAENLMRHGIKLSKLNENRTFSGETFWVDSLVYDKDSFQHHKALTLEGKFKAETRSFKKGDYIIDLAQPLSNLIFYMLEPQSEDGLVHWNFFDEALKKQGKKDGIRYPVFKYF